MCGTLQREAVVEKIGAHTLFMSQACAYVRGHTNAFCQDRYDSRSFIKNKGQVRSQTLYASICLLAVLQVQFHGPP